MGEGSDGVRCHLSSEKTQTQPRKQNKQVTGGVAGGYMGEELSPVQSGPGVVVAGEGDILQNVIGGLEKAHVTRNASNIHIWSHGPRFVLNPEL